MRSVLILESDPWVVHHLVTLLRGWHCEPVLVGSAGEALALNLERLTLAVVSLDGPRAEGLEFLRGLRHQPAPPPVVILAGTGDTAVLQEFTANSGVSAVVRPFLPEDLDEAIRDALSRSRPSPANEVESSTGGLGPELALWQSAKMREIREIIQQAAGVDVTVLICGETGTGKDVVARAIHQLSPRQDRPFVKVNCAAVPRELLESELFGHERGAFTGAHQLKIGRFEAANHGTVFLDEIGDLHPALQAKLLHVLQDGTFSRVGGKASIKVDVRVLAATNRDLERAVLEDRFREDLYYRLNVIQIVVPPLRERREEIPLFAQYFVERYTRLYNRQGFALGPGALDQLLRHRYPGNVRELENLIKRMIVLNDPQLTRTPLPAGANGGDGHPAGASAAPPPSPLSLKDIARRAARAAEREAIARVLEKTAWNRVRAAKLLRISYRALLYKIKDAGLERVPLRPDL